MSHQIDIQLTKTPNWDLLSQQLIAAMPAICTGGGYSSDDMMAHVTFNIDPVSDTDIATVQQICTAHDPTQQTVQQVSNAASDISIKQLSAAIDTEIAHFKAGTFTAATIPTTAAVQVELIRLANDVSTLAVLLKRRLM